MSDQTGRNCPECGEWITPVRRMGPHISGHRRRAKAKYFYVEGDKHPYEMKACLWCHEVSAIQTRRDFCSYRCSKMGARNPQWKGAAASPNAARIRAHSRFDLPDACSQCGRSDLRIHRHHRDRDTYNNDASNIALICSTCHAREHHPMTQGSQ